MSKRRRTSSVTSSRQDGESECGESDSQSISEPCARKRKKLDPSEQCQQLYDALRTHKNDDGSLLCEAFVRAPKRRQEPGYYEVVTNPMDFIKVQQKIKTDEYEDFEDMTADIELMVNNAKAFYKRTSQEYKDAVDLWELFCSLKDQLKTDGDLDAYRNRNKPRRVIKEEVDDTSESSNSPNDELANQLEELLSVVMSATDDGRPLYLPFQLLPSAKDYPDYYGIITNPIDLKTIGRKIQKNKYSTLDELETDLVLLTKNACRFNEPWSQIYKDAKALKKLIHTKKIEIDHSKNSPGKCSERIRSKRLRGSQSASAIAAALEEDDDEDSSGEDDDPTDDEETDDPMWMLYQSVKNTANNLSQPFWKLPSKRYYPDYYKEIKNPISLQQIRDKLVNGKYGTVSDVAGDLNLMFYNAKKYNRPDSRLYKDAVKLQKQMQSKVPQLLDFQQESGSEGEDSEDENDSRKQRRKATPRLKVKNPQLKKKLKMFVKALINYVCEDGRQPILMFMEKPSKKLYPDYYQIIKQPIDLLTIENNIKDEKYATEEDALEDFKLMFKNCKEYNEESSLIYKDAKNLEKVLLDKVRELGGAARTPKITAKPRKVMGSAQTMKMRTLYETIRDHKDQRGRQLSTIFTKLPSRFEYPDYYEVIKRPIDLDKISQKLKTNAYESLEEVAQDLILMCDNACKYNEPDSQIYKDALILHRVTLQTKLQLREDEESVPDVQAAVQDLLVSLFTSFYNHQDEEGRCFSDSMAELPEYDEIDGQKVRSLSLDLIKRRLDRGLYRRLDVFQTDIFLVMERARNLSRTDSQAFEDSVELQSFFIKLRDELCRGGDLLNSPALNYSLYTLADAVEQTRQQKPQEQPEDEMDTSRTGDESKPTENGDTEEDSGMVHNKQMYRPGDFVYVEPKERGMDWSILNIDRMWTAEDGKQMLHGNFFYRPNETYHVATRKFLEQEVFKSDMNVTVQLSEVLGLCAVMFVKDYFKYKPEGFEDKDVYVCESRYSNKSRSFKKIKYWPHSTAERYNFIEREECLEPKRVVSVFRDRVDKHIEEIAELEENEKLSVQNKPDLEIIMPNSMPGMRYYEQINVSFGILRTGDFVYIRNEEGSRLIGQVDSIARDHQGATYIRGPWLLSPREIPQSPGRLFYKQEVFLSCIEGVNPIHNIVGRCAVLEHQEYISSRPTEIPEKDVYICESVYDESIRQVVKLEPEGLKKYSHSNAVHEDEIYFFRRLINPPKIGCNASQDSVHEKNENSMDTIKMEMTDMMDDSLDGDPPSVGSGETIGQSNSMSGSTPAPISAKKAKKDGKKLVTGYILYSSDVRRTVSAKNPDSTFGDVSRIVGNEWRNLPQDVKTAWEEKAAKMNEEMAAKHAASEAEALSRVGQIGPNHIVPPGEMIWECCWDNCDFQFEDMSDSIEHAVGSGPDPNGHVHTYFANSPPDSEWHCQWRGCMRIRKGAQPFPNLQRLARHVKEVHIQKSTGRPIPLHERSKNFVLSRKPRAAAQLNANQQLQPQQTFNNHGVSNANHVLGQSRNTPSPHSQYNNNIGIVNQPPKPLEPMFVSVPPKPQRLLHSEAYIKYIEGLSADNRTVNNWEKQLKARPENTQVPDQARLPSHWLANGVGNHGNMVNALWTLRDFMVRDALGISKLV